MIDCNITTNYLTERDRMTQKGKLCEVCYGTECWTIVNKVDRKNRKIK